MTRLPANPSFLKRVTNVTIVALCTASSLALLGAVPAEWAKAHRSTNAVAFELPRVAEVEVDDALAQPAAARMGRLADAEIKLPEPADAPAETAAAPATHVVRMEVTAYCPCTKCCGSNAQGITASGKLVDYNGGKFVAADTRVLPFGRKLVVPGYADNAPVEVIDRGGAIKGNKLDLYFPTHDEALVWGRQHLDVTVYE
jgi:3D (Asp-Asp-Asp) domain-containing protein